VLVAKSAPVNRPGSERCLMIQRQRLITRLQDRIEAGVRVLECFISEAASAMVRADNQGSRRTAADPVGGNAREFPVRLELQRDILAYLRVAGIAADNQDRLLFRSTPGKTKRPTDKPPPPKHVCRTVNRRLKCSGLPKRLSPHSFRVNVANRVMWRSFMAVRKLLKFGAARAT
jgi:hypothetical protein